MITEITAVWIYAGSVRETLNTEFFDWGRGFWMGVHFMNILFFLKPKAELDLVYEDDSIGMAMERIENHQFSSIPMINEKTGRYIGTLSEGDLLRTLRKKDGAPFGMENRSVMSVRRKRDYKCVRADADIEELFAFVKEQNFVPVVDDTGVLIGIVLRSTILEFVFGILQKSAGPAGSIKASGQ